MFDYDALMERFRELWRSNKSTFILGGLAGFGFVFIFVLLLLLFLFTDENSPVKVEVQKQLWQLAIVVFVGGFITFAFAELKRELEASENRRQYLKSFHAQVLTAYNRAKKVRRVLRVKAVTVRDKVRYVQQEGYQTEMVELQDVQLQFESFKRHVKLSPQIFKDWQNLEAQFKTMETYLRKILREFEGRLLASKELRPLCEFPIMEAYIASAENSGFEENFATPFDKVETVLITQLTR